MAVRVVVEKGPDQGKALALDGRAEARIGRGPGNQLMLSDPAWQGVLRVALNQGVCKVTNQTPTPIYLGGKVFPPGEQRVWFQGEPLQPTAQTLLVLHVEEAAGAEEPARPASPRRKAVQLAAIVACFLVAGVLFVLPSPQGADDADSPAQVQAHYRRLEARLRQLHERGDAEAAGRVLPLLRDARLAQTRGRPAEAFRLYRRLRAEVEADLGTPDNPRDLPDDVAEALRSARDFVNRQLIDLSTRGQKRSD